MKKTIDCEKASELLTLKLYGELEQGEQDLSQHLENCESCRHDEQAFLKMMEFDQHFKVMEPLPKLRTKSPYFSRWLAIAALLLVSSAGLLLHFQQETSLPSFIAESKKAGGTSIDLPYEVINFDPFTPITLPTDSRYKSISSLDRDAIYRIERRLGNIKPLQLFGKK